MSFVCSFRCREPLVSPIHKWLSRQIERNGFCDARLANLGSESLRHGILHGQRWNEKTFCSIMGKGSRRTSIHRPPQSNYFLIRIELLARNVATSSSLVFNQFQACSIPMPMRHDKLQLWRTHIRNASDKSRRHPVHDERLFAYFHVERLSRRNQTSTWTVKSFNYWRKVMA